MIESTHTGTPRRLCVGCHQVRPLGMFERTSPDFPTRDGRMYKCRDCGDGSVKYRPVEGKAMRVLEVVG